MSAAEMVRHLFAITLEEWLFFGLCVLSVYGLAKWNLARSRAAK